MNIPLILALLAGQHRHRYNDSSGCCSTCGKVHDPHIWKDGSCEICGFAGCEHTEGWKIYNSAQHSCKVCGHKENHVLGVFLHDDKYCRSCIECDAGFLHSFDKITANSCGTCSDCGDSFGSHRWNTDGRCSRCNYKCKHSSIGANLKCNICGKTVVTGSYYVLSGTYKGSYIYEGVINGQHYYRRHQYNTASGEWDAENYYLVVINISTPKDDLVLPKKSIVETNNKVSFIPADSAAVKTAPIIANEEYVVKEGDTLESIVIRFYGSFSMSKVNAIQSANKMANPNALSIGQKLIIPMN